MGSRMGTGYREVDKKRQEKLVVKLGEQNAKTE
jgi:hypothetical protein